MRIGTRPCALSSRIDTRAKWRGPLWGGSTRSPTAAAYRGTITELRHNGIGMGRGAKTTASLFFMATLLMASSSDNQVTIEDTGSTNRLGVRLTLEDTGHATVEPRQGQPQEIQLDHDLCRKFLHDVKALGSLAALPANHCAKSVSFGSSLYLEYKGVRSPDLSCSTQDSRLIDIQKRANDLLRAAREAAGIPVRRMVFQPIAPR